MIKIAVVTENETRIGNHFGMAPFYKIFMVEDGRIVREEQREKPHHETHHHHNHDRSGEHNHQRGMGSRMIAAIEDCQVLICGGMGTPALQKAQAAGLDVYLTGGDIQDAVQAYLRGELSSDERRIHAR